MLIPFRKAGKSEMADDFADGSSEVADSAFVVDVDGFEGPLDLLLELARRQKVDLARISILALVEQYLAFIEEARRLRLELAADYLVMAAWLAYLKSRLLLPALPRAWPTGAITGLRARGGCSVNIRWRAGTLEEAVLNPRIAGRRQVRLGTAVVALDLKPGRPVRLRGDRLTIA